MSPPPPERVTRSTRTNSKQQPASQTPSGDLPAAKRPRRVGRNTAGADIAPSALNQDLDYLPTPRTTQQSNHSLSVNQSLEIDEITLQNYHQAKKDWPLARIQAQLDKQKKSNHQLSAAVISEGQAILEDLDHTLHMIAMVSGVGIKKLKRSLGLLGGTHGENPWHRWLSFAIDANKVSMPPRGDPNASDQLTSRNQVNSRTYQALDDDQYDVFTSRVFYALGGYPDYSAITITEDDGVFGDVSTLVPEIPKLSEEEELRYRPLYDKLVDKDKVEKDRKLNTPAASACKEEKRSLQSIKKIAIQLARDHQLFGTDYYLIACSSNGSGSGWCREYTTRDELSQWVDAKAELQTVFPIYCQHGSTFEEIKGVVAANKSSQTKKTSNNQSDIDKKNLRAKLNDLLKSVLGEVPRQGFPCVANPLEAIKEQKIKVTIERDADSTMTEEEFMKGFSLMDAKARRHWLSDIDTKKFKVKAVNIQPSPAATTVDADAAASS
ncbi:uncharacterized protein MELLADRAFT_88472 [Melampsora larici-populina 98AG31]|uniref:Uncharacterized protein n=1 Tax=Melampsora larici-populina (strain 98AG31 / pathotype 3-4-7) TaxID=747676 RepID=F4RRU6_MELLP|nr:uncharacterized protein MELLADRAFT_88472 [Melampsora larici-populina 98AG31]EGG04892.1 hypothetical protein MELLADRAFT_88472 [Melampsora larici-populina 98AG31]